MADFVRAVATADIPDGQGRLWRHGAKRIALFRTPAGVYAADNRCPHQDFLGHFVDAEPDDEQQDEGERSSGLSTFSRVFQSK
jgi:nitrite reductase/ring-hydroxylating ferredoxin subunit